MAIRIKQNKMVYGQPRRRLDSPNSPATPRLQYNPTDSSNHARPRTLAAGYDSETQILRVRFRDGTGWQYRNVPPEVWKNFRRVQSPGKFINRVLNSYDYGPDASVNGRAFNPPPTESFRAPYPGNRPQGATAAPNAKPEKQGWRTINGRR